MSVSLPENKIGIIGFGDLGKQIQSFLAVNGLTNFVYFDDTLQQEKSANLKFKEFQKPNLATEYYVGLGYKNLRMRLEVISKLAVLKFKFPSIIHSTCFVSGSSKIADGVYIYPKCIIDHNVEIREGSILNNGVIVSHDSIVGNCCYISPGAILSGKVVIGDCTFIGAGSILSDGVQLGKDVTVGIGTVVTQNVPDGSFVIGNPMKFVNKINLV